MGVGSPRERVTFFWYSRTCSWPRASVHKCLQWVPFMKQLESQRPNRAAPSVYVPISSWLQVPKRNIVAGKRAPNGDIVAGPRSTPWDLHILCGYLESKDFLNSCWALKDRRPKSDNSGRFLTEIRPQILTLHSRPKWPTSSWSHRVRERKSGASGCCSYHKNGIFSLRGPSSVRYTGPVMLCLLGCSDSLGAAWCSKVQGFSQTRGKPPAAASL